MTVPRDRFVGGPDEFERGPHYESNRAWLEEQNKPCPCGRELHYSNPETERQVRQLVARLGRYQKITVAGLGTYMVDRHYIALHGVKGEDIPLLGFERIV